MRGAAGLIAALVLANGFALLAGSAAAQMPVPTYSPGEIRSIMAHGPWPQPPLRDPSNRVSGNADAIALGRVLSVA